MKLKEVSQDGALVGYMIECPGCTLGHLFRVAGDGQKWSFNGNMESPTFTPSIIHRWEFGEDHNLHVCHLILTDGQIQFCSDCTHELKGQTVALPDWN